MKVLLVYLNLDQGGVQRMMVNVANYLSSKGYNVTIILCQRKGHYLNFVNKNVEILSLESDNRIKLIKYLTKYINKYRPEVLFTAVPHLNLIAIIAKLISGNSTRVIISERSNTIEEFRKSPVGAYKLSFTLIPILYRFADSIIAVSKGVASDLAKVALINPEKVTTVYNPAFNKKMLVEANETIEEVWLKDNSVPVVIGVGRLTDQKDFPLLIDAIKIVLIKRKVRLIIIGEGPLYTSLDEQIKKLKLEDYIKLAGFQSTPISWISKAQLFVLSSKWEGFGNIVVEALAAGTTIVSTDCKSGPAEILQNGKFGYLCKVGDKNDLAEKIEYALENPMPTNFLRQRAENFDVDIVMKNYERILSGKSTVDHEISLPEIM